MTNIWPENHFSLPLDDSPVPAMEDESLWKITNNLMNATAVPNFGKNIYPDALEVIRPGTVKIISTGVL